MFECIDSIFGSNLSGNCISKFCAEGSIAQAILDSSKKAAQANTVNIIERFRGNELSLNNVHTAVMGFFGEKNFFNIDLSFLPKEDRELLIPVNQVSSATLPVIPVPEFGTHTEVKIPFDLGALALHPQPAIPCLADFLYAQGTPNAYNVDEIFGVKKDNGNKAIFMQEFTNAFTGGLKKACLESNIPEERCHEIVDGSTQEAIFARINPEAVKDWLAKVDAFTSVDEVRKLAHEQAAAFLTIGKEYFGWTPKDTIVVRAKEVLVKNADGSATVAPAPMTQEDMDRLDASIKGIQEFQLRQAESQARREANGEGEPWYDWQTHAASWSLKGPEERMAKWKEVFATYKKVLAEEGKDHHDEVWAEILQAAEAASESFKGKLKTELKKYLIELFSVVVVVEATALADWLGLESKTQGDVVELSGGGVSPPPGKTSMALAFRRASNNV